ncbi:AAA family ATPase [Aeromicrobium sp. Sec7.5]|uniref:AAA family ATPase n=1 Tax=Aeromicrobium sp. Sec7.5 TaxID=3121276 RepID=UPI002FE45293
MTDVAIAAAGAPWEPEALAAIDRAPDLRLVRRCVDVSELLAVVRTGAATVAVVDPSLPGLDVDVVRELSGAGATVAACGDDGAAAALGVLRRPAPGELGQVDWKAPVPVPGPPPPEGGAEATEAGRVLVVWGPAGAPGRSTLALALASALAALGRRTVLVDADVAGGTLAQQLGVLDDLSGVLAACRAAGNGRAHEVDQHLVEVEPGLDLLTGIPRADLWPHLRVGAFGTVLDRLALDHAHVVLDVGSGLDLDGAVGRSRHALTRYLLDRADDVVVIGRADPMGLSRLVRGLAELHDVVATPPRSLVVSLAGLGPGWSEREVGEALRRLAGRAPDLFLPADPAAVQAALMQGRSPRVTAPASPFVRRVDDLVSSLGLDVR